LVWLWPEELLELTDRGASRVVEIFLLETFADALGALSLFCLTEVLFTSLLFLTSADLRDVLVSLTALELPATLADVFISTPRETPVAEDLSTPERLLSIDLLWADFELFTLLPLTEALSRVLAFWPEFVLA